MALLILRLQGVTMKIRKKRSKTDSRLWSLLRTLMVHADFVNMLFGIFGIPSR
jgi:hypothetical protein